MQTQRKVVQLDYIEHGSDEHAQLIGLKKCTKKEAEKLAEQDKKITKWKIEDVTKYGLSVSERFLDAVLEQMFSELTTSRGKVQSENPAQPGYAPLMWLPANPIDAQGNPVNIQDIQTKGII